MIFATVARKHPAPRPPLRDMKEPRSHRSRGSVFGTCQPFRDDVAHRSGMRSPEIRRLPPTSAAVPLSRTLWAGDVGQTANWPVEVMSPSRDRSRPVSPCPTLWSSMDGHVRFLVRKSPSPPATPVLDEVDDTSILKTGRSPATHDLSLGIMLAAGPLGRWLSRSDLVLWHQPAVIWGQLYDRYWGVLRTYFDLVGRAKYVAIDPKGHKVGRKPAVQ